VLLHSRDPAAVWRNASMQFEDVSCDMEKQVVSVGIWPRGCNDQRVVQNFTMGACYSPVKTMVQSYKCDGAGNATRLVWLVNGNDTQREWTLNETVPCPHTDPIDAETVKADGQCHGSAIQNSTQGWVMQDQAEVSEYGLKPFQKQGAPSSLDEAAERPVYSLMNNNLIDQGSPIYGDVSAVFSSKYIHGGALLSAVDTGFVETCCLEKRSCFPWAPQHDCKAVSPFKQLGTMKHNKHLFLINEDFWGPASTLRSIFRRMEGDWGAQPLPGTNFLNYFEAAVLGQLKAPASVAGLKDWQPMIQRKFVAGVGGKDVCGTTLSEPGEILHWSVPNTLRDRFGLTPSTVGEEERQGFGLGAWSEQPAFCHQAFS
ncbi:unnamed protein product, partial [Durusdinium trenchii]